MMQRCVPVLGFVAPSGSGKTTLLCKLMPQLRQRGLRVGCLKRSHHPLVLDQPGKDSHALATAGAEQVLLAAAGGWGLMDYAPRVGPDGQMPLASLIERFDTERLDLLLIEGFRQEHCPKIEVHRIAAGKPPLYPDDPDIIAVATDARLPPDAAPVRLPIEDPGAIADFILARLEGGGLATAEPREELLGRARGLRRAGIEPRAGWLSVRGGERCWLLRLALAGDDPGPADIMACEIAGPEAADGGNDGADIRIAQTEVLIHRQIYAAEPRARAIVGARMPYTAAVGFQGRSFEPLDPDGLALLGSVPVLSLAPDEIAHKAPAAIAEWLVVQPVCILAGQGAYAWGADLAEALERVALLERSAQVFSLGRQTAV
jgi:molybdopterin-guanine dinucleotide biosynthesis protein MobB